jgi:formamidopyrimidine-DNA glycosylase
MPETAIRTSANTDDSKFDNIQKKPREPVPSLERTFSPKRAQAKYTESVPEYPDLEVYRSALTQRVVGRRLKKLRLFNPFVLRSVDPKPAELEGRSLQRIERLQKRLVLVFDDDFFAVIHLMIAGRLQWKEAPFTVVPKTQLLAFDFENGTLLLTEVSTKKRASLYIVRGVDNVKIFDRGGLEVFASTLEQFAEVLRRENHTLKRSLTDPRLFSAIGNAYSDEILHRAKMSPVKQTKTLTEGDVVTLFEATKTVLEEWRVRLQKESEKAWPSKVTAFRPEMAVHGKYKQPCPICEASVQRIRHADNETNYCPKCQTDGKLLADRSLSRLLKDDWPKSLDALEEYVAERGQGQVQKRHLL